MDNLKAAIYVRVSTDDQATEGYSIEAQKYELKKYCSTKQIEIYKIYSDEGYSGKNLERPYLKEMIIDGAKKQFDIVLVWDMSRLSRDVADTALLIKELSNNKISIYAITQGIDTQTDSGVFYAQIMSCMSQLERTKIIERAKLGKAEKARQGGTTGGIIYGYDSINGLLVVNEREASIIKDIFRWYIQGKGIMEIRDTLNNLGIMTKKNKHFTEHAIRYYLTNHKYAGLMTYGKYSNCSDREKKKLEKDYIISKGKHEAIIDEQTFNKVQEIMNSKKFSKKRGHPAVHLLSGFIICPHCGDKMYHYYGKPKVEGKKTYHYYACSTYKKLRKCVNTHIRADIIENAVINRIKKIINDDSVITDVVKSINGGSKVDISLLSRQIDTIDNNIKKLENGIKKVESDYILGEINVNQYKNLVCKTEVKLKELEENRDLLEKDRNVACNSTIDYNDVYNTLKNFDLLFNSLDANDKKKLMQSLIYRVNLNTNFDFKDIEFRFNVPNRNMPEESEEGARLTNIKVVTNEHTLNRITSKRGSCTTVTIPTASTG